MSTFAKLVAAIRGWLAPRYRVTSVDEIPEQPHRHMLYLVGEDPAWQAAMLCPCKCGVLIQLSLIPADRPRWKARIDTQGRPSLMPSVWRTGGCQAHFFLRDGRIYWC